MPEPLAQLLIAALALYFSLGLLFALPFVARWVDQVDPGAQGSSWAFRALILPGSALFWPILLSRVLRGQQAPDEHNPHRDRAGAPR